MNEAERDLFDQLIEMSGRALAFEGLSDRPRPFQVAQLMAEAALMLRADGVADSAATDRAAALIFERADELRGLVNVMVREAIAQAMAETLAEANAEAKAVESTKH
jgi:hypothetical protein